MKKIVFFLLSSLLLASCSKSKEEKAAIIAEQFIKSVAYYPDTYESIEVKVDSAYHTVYVDEDAIKAAKALVEAESKMSRYESQIRTARSSMAIWSGPYQSAFGKEEYNQAKEEYDEAVSELSKCQGVIETQKNIILEREKDLLPYQFVGWLITHKYRLGDSEGKKTISNVLIFADPEVNEILFTIHEDDTETTKAIATIEKVCNGEY